MRLPTLRKIPTLYGLVSAALLLVVASLPGQVPDDKSRDTSSIEKPASVPPAERKAFEQLLDSSRKRLAAQKPAFEQGRLTLDRYLDASSQLRTAETRVATTHAERISAAERHADRLREVEARERLEFDRGRSTAADVAEARQARDLAEIERIAAHEVRPPDILELQKRIERLEQKLDNALRRLESRGGPRP